MESTKMEIPLLRRLIRDHQRYLAMVDEEIQENSVLSSSLIQEIREMEDRITEKRSRLEALATRLTAIRESRDDMVRDIASLYALAPDRPSLPDELLLQIFMDAVEAEESGRRSLAMTWTYYPFGKMPLSISGVCQRWRRIALGAPLLWRYLNLRSGADEASPTLYPLGHWLKNSSIISTQEISLDQWRSHHDSPLPSISTAETRERRSKVRRIEVSCMFDASSSAEWPQNHPLAEEVVLISYGGESICDFFFPIVSQAPKLVLNGIRPSSWTQATWWNSLQDLTITDASSGGYLVLRSRDILDLLTSAINLLKLSITWSASRIDSARLPQSSPLTHGKFKSLTCAFDAIVTYLNPLQSSINLPNFTEIIFRDTPRIDSPLLRAWTAVFNTIHPFPLRHLQLPNITYNVIAHFISLFDHLPSLERLTLTGDATDALLQRMIIDHKESGLPVSLPLLVRLDIHGADVTDNTLEQLLTSRRALKNVGQVVKGIDKLNIYECPLVTPQGWQRIIALLETEKKK